LTFPPSYRTTTFTPQEVENNLGSISAAWDQSRAMFSLKAIDCLGSAASDVQVTISGPQDPQTTGEQLSPHVASGPESPSWLLSAAPPHPTADQSATNVAP
jgi:hypothetical protein